MSSSAPTFSLLAYTESHASDARKTKKPSAASSRTRSVKPVPHTRNKFKPNKLEFDEKARHEYLTGFRKRKAARVEFAQKKRAELEKEERRVSRKEGREAKREQAKENVRREKEAYGAASGSEEDDDQEDEDEEQEEATEYDAPEHHTTVVVEEWDPDQDDDADQRSGSTSSSKKVSKTEQEALPPSSKRMEKRAKSEKAAKSLQQQQQSRRKSTPALSSSNDITSILSTPSIDASTLPEIQHAPRDHTGLSHLMSDKERHEAQKSKQGFVYEKKSKFEKQKERIKRHQQNEKFKEERKNKNIMRRAVGGKLKGVGRPGRGGAKKK